jgi:adenylate kinase
MAAEFTDTKAIESIKKWLGSGSINIFGLPFAGKDTQGKKLAKALDAELIGGGDIIRNYHQDEALKKIIATGKLAPKEEFLRIIPPYLGKLEFRNKPIILSSVGRWHGEELGVLEAARKSNHEIKAAIFLEISEQVLRERWRAQDATAGHHRGERHDDREEALEVRINEFEIKTLPVIDFYRSKNILVEIDGSLSAQETFDEILRSLYKLSLAS